MGKYLRQTDGDLNCVIGFPFVMAAKFLADPDTVPTAEILLTGSIKLRHSRV